MDVIKKFFANFSRHGIVSRIPIKKVKIVDIKKVELKNTIGTPTVIHGQNVDSINIDRNDLKSDKGTTESLKEFDDILKGINTVSNNGNPSLDEIDDVIREESQTLQIPRFDLQDLFHSCDSNNKFLDELADENDIIDDPLETDELNNFLTLDNINEIIDLDEINEPGDVATDSWKEVISISSEGSQIQELIDREELVKLRSDNDKNELTTKPKTINKKVNKVGNDYNGVNEINETTFNNDLNIEANENKTINEEKETNDITETDKNEDDKFENVNNESEINGQATENFSLDSDCGYRSSDFEFITEEEAKMDGLIVHFKANKLKRNVRKLKRVKTIEIAVDKYSNSDINKCSLNAKRTRPRIQREPRRNKCRTCYKAKTPERKPNGDYIKQSQVKSPRSNNFEPNNIQNDPKTEKFTPNTLRLIRKHPRMNTLIPKPTNLIFKDPGLSYTSTHIQNNIVLGLNKENIEVSDNELFKENSKRGGKNSYGPTIQLACTQQSNLLQINYPEPNQENVPRINIDPSSQNDFGPIQENISKMNIDPSSQKDFGPTQENDPNSQNYFSPRHENVPIMNVDPSTQNDLGSGQDNVSRINTDPISQNYFGPRQEKNPGIHGDPSSQNDFGRRQEHFPRMDVEPSTQNDFDHRQENVPRINVDPRSQNDFGPRQENVSRMNIDPSSQNDFGPIQENDPNSQNYFSPRHENVPIMNVDPSTQNDLGSGQENVSRINTDPSSQNDFGPRQEKNPGIHGDPGSQNDFSRRQEHFPRMNVEPSIQNDFDHRQENVPRINVDPRSRNDFGPRQENVSRMNIDPCSQNDFGPIQENVSRMNIDPSSQYDFNPIQENDLNSQNYFSPRHENVPTMNVDPSTQNDLGSGQENVSRINTDPSSQNDFGLRQENLPGLHVDPSSQNDFGRRQEHFPKMNVEPSTQNNFDQRQENVSRMNVDPRSQNNFEPRQENVLSSQHDFGPRQENVSRMNIDPCSRNDFDHREENIPRMNVEPISQNNFDPKQQNVLRMNVDPSTQNNFGPSQENVPGLNNVDPGPNHSQENCPGFIYFGQNTSNEVPQQTNFVPESSTEESVPKINNAGIENSDVHEDLSSNVDSRTSNPYNMADIEKWRAYQRRKQLNRQHFFLDYSYRENHRILNDDDYHQLFDPNSCPLPNRSVRLLENKSIMSTMLVEYQGVGFDMRMMRENIEIEDEEVKQQAAESARKILEMYPAENKKRRRRF